MHGAVHVFANTIGTIWFVWHFCTQCWTRSLTHYVPLGFEKPLGKLSEKVFFNQLPKEMHLYSYEKVVLSGQERSARLQNDILLLNLQLATHVSSKFIIPLDLPSNHERKAQNCVKSLFKVHNGCTLTTRYACWFFLIDSKFS